MSRRCTCGRKLLQSALFAGVLGGCSAEVLPGQVASSEALRADRVVIVGVTGCGLVPRVASGFSVGDNLFVTVAHTLRGAEAVTVDQQPVSVLALDHRTDIAVLSLRTAEASPPNDAGHGEVAEVVEVVESSRATILKPIRPTAQTPPSNPVRVESQAVKVRTVGSIDIDEPIDKQTYRRDGLVVVAETGSIVSGDSGAPIVNEKGQLLGMIFASGRGSAETAYAVAASEIQNLLGALPGKTGAASVSTGRCDAIVTN